jgi:hypothetical protein
VQRSVALRAMRPWVGLVAGAEAEAAAATADAS